MTTQKFFTPEENIDYSDIIDTSVPRREPTHPGDILRQEFLEPLGMSASALAREIRVAPSRVTRILNREAAMTAGTAVRLERFFSVSARFWMQAQSMYEVEAERRKADADLQRIRPYAASG